MTSASEATCLVGAAQQAGPVALALSSERGQDAEPDAFVYVAAADGVSLQGVVPSSGPTTGNNRIHLVGANLTDEPVSVTVDGAPTAGAIVDGEQVTTLAPRHAVGAVDVGVTTGGRDVLAAQRLPLLRGFAAHPGQPGPRPDRGRDLRRGGRRGFCRRNDGLLGRRGA